MRTTMRSIKARFRSRARRAEGASFRALIALIALLALASPGCTIDDEVVEGKHCYTGSGDPDKICMTGYECKCGGGECLCVKIEALGQSPLEPRLAPASADPSRCLLRRLGLTPP